MTDIPETNEELKNRILEEMRKPGYSPRRSKELARDMGIPKAQYKEFRDTLRRLFKNETILRSSGSRWEMPQEQARIIGKIQVTRKGDGFLLPDDPSRDDLYIPESYLGPALNGDKVLAAVEYPRGRGIRHFGRVLEIIERASPRFVAVITKDGKARPEDPRNPFDYEITSEEPHAPEGDKVLFEVEVWPGEGKKGAGKILEVLGPSGEPATEIAAILAGFEAPGPFPEEVKEEARALDPKFNEEELKWRMDLRDLPTVTIDPKDARDFDDALSYEELEDGTIRIGVHIADVAHFVRPGSELDREAQERSTSIYLPSRVIPMIPEELSNNLCSLRPEEDRRAKTALITFSENGERLGYQICRSVIRSDRRFTYNEAKQIIDGGSLEGVAPEISEMIIKLNGMSQTLRENRLEKGSIELNMQEIKVITDENGETLGLKESEHDESHELVEELMLSANIVLAEWCKNNGMPVLYRIHESPNEEDVEELAMFLTACGYPFKAPLRRHRLNQIVEKAHGKPEEHSVNLAILKSFKQAVYGPDGSLGHFALNFPSYMHFTSPIRRYPDLHLHQQMDAVFAKNACKLPKKLNKAPSRDKKELEHLGGHCSMLERRAMKIEEAVKDFRKLELLSKSDQKIFKAIVTGIRKFGIFVEIEGFFVEGMLPRRMVEAEGYSTREESPSARSKAHNKGMRGSGRKPGFHLGQEVKVKITNVDLAARLCEMAFIGVV